MKDLKASTVIAWVALFIVIGGTATAASGLINGKKIKPGTITAKQIKNKTITKSKLAPTTVKSLKGAKGPQGPAGGKGATGSTGPVGALRADGTVEPLFAELMNLNLNDGEPQIPLTLDVDPGIYMLSAKANVTSNREVGLNYLDCTIWTDETHGVDTANSDASFNVTVNLSMIAVAEVQDKIELRCAAWDGPASASQLKLIAVPVQN